MQNQKRSQEKENKHMHLERTTCVLNCACSHELNVRNISLPLSISLKCSSSKEKKNKELIGSKFEKKIFDNYGFFLFMVKVLVGFFVSITFNAFARPLFLVSLMHCAIINAYDHYSNLQQMFRYVIVTL